MPDPVSILFLCTGSDEDIMREFRAARDEVERRVRELLDTISKGDTK